MDAVLHFLVTTHLVSGKTSVDPTVTWLQPHISANFHNNLSGLNVSALCTVYRYIYELMVVPIMKAHILSSHIF
jgi:hypothetical protein